MAPTCTVSVMYPFDTKFNMDYYLSSHMPLVQKNWSGKGLSSWSVDQILGTAERTEPPYGVVAHLSFDSQESFEAAGTSDAGKEIMADISNFADKKPLILIAAKKGSS